MTRAHCGSGISVDRSFVSNIIGIQGGQIRSALRQTLENGLNGLLCRKLNESQRSHAPLQMLS